MICFSSLVKEILLQEENIAGPGGVLGTGATGGSDPQTLGANFTYNDKDMRLATPQAHVYRRNLNIDSKGRKRKKKKKHG